ncbi:MAG: HRDC domain-containing protein [Planctomycetota bacterium]
MAAPALDTNVSRTGLAMPHAAMLAGRGWHGRVGGGIVHAVKSRGSRRQPRSTRQVATELSPLLVTDPSALRQVLDELSQAGRFAFDTEFVMEDSYASEVCLIQAATESRVVLIDPLGGLDDTGFWNLVADERLEKIVHSGMEDLALCVQRTGQTPRNVFDLQIAGGLVGLDYPLSLMKLVRATCGARLHKSQTLTDWRHRPLSADQIQYAKDDVAHLPGAYQVIRRKLETLDRWEWVREELERLEQPETYRRSEEAQVLRLKGGGTLDGRGLAVARELYQVREALAKQFNRPARVLLKDYLIVEIARQQWTTPAQIRGLRGVQVSNTAVQRLADAVKRGLASPPEVWPEVASPEVDAPEEAALISLATAVVRAYCHEQDIAHQLAATKQDIRALVYSFTRGAPAERSKLAGGWRGRTVGRLLTAFFSGEKRVGIRRDGEALRIAIE